MAEQRRHYKNKLAFEIDSWDLKVALEAGENIVVVDARSLDAYQAVRNRQGKVRFENCREKKTPCITRRPAGVAADAPLRLSLASVSGSSHRIRQVTPSLFFRAA